MSVKDLEELTFEDGQAEETTDVGLQAHASQMPGAKPKRGALTVLKGPEPGRLFLLTKDTTVIGRSKDADFHIDDKGLSRKHARVALGAGRYVIEDLGSSNGTYVDGTRIERADLADGARVVLSANVVIRFNLLDEVEEQMTRTLFEASTRDALTGLYNRRYLDERLAAEVSYAHRHKEMLGFLLFDIDHFKQVNDEHGHPAGDAVLAAVGERMNSLVRAEDVVARYGGEEIAVLVRGITFEGLRVLAERVRRAVAETVVSFEGRSLQVTVSIGVATLSECDAHATGDLLVALADERLYRAKTTGRNRVCAA